MEKIDMLAGMLIITAMLCLAIFTVFVGQNERLATLGTVSMALLAVGLSGGAVIHGYEYENKIRPESLLSGFFGVSAVALAQLPAVLTGLSLYGLSAVDPTATRLFLISQAVAEETFFANVLYAFLSRASVKTVANVGTAAIFMLFHAIVYANQTLVLLSVFFSRLALNFVYERGGLGASALSHVIVNAFAGG